MTSCTSHDSNIVHHYEHHMTFRYDIMLMCWNEEPWKRPTFTELRSRFDAMLLADGKEEYIDLRIDHSKLYYQQIIPATKKKDADGLSADTDHRTSLTGKECSPKHPTAPALSPGHTSHHGDQANSREYLIMEQAHVCSGRSERDQTYENVGRPVSMYLSREHDRSERQNPYVAEPSRVAAVTLALPNSNGGLARGGSDGAIELCTDHVRWSGGVQCEQREQNSAEILFQVSEDDS